MTVPNLTHRLKSIKICYIASCNMPTVARGYCGAHYKKFKKYGDPLTNHIKVRSSALCEITDCDGVVHYRNWCKKHYTRWKRYGDTSIVKPKGIRPSIVQCAVLECEYVGRVKRGMCGKHYQRYLKHGDTDIVAFPDVCTFTGCDSPHASKGHCSRHYTRLRTHGDPGVNLYHDNGGVCSVYQCTKKAVRTGFCHAHYEKNYRHGNPLIDKRLTADTRMGIYAVTNIITGRRYIGSTKDIGRRKARHWHKLKSGKHPTKALQTEWDQYSAEAFGLEMLEIVEKVNDLVIREQWWIDNSRNLYNTFLWATRSGIRRK